jgi:diguanylate cyclase
VSVSGHMDRRTRWAWRLIAAGVTCWLFGETAWAILEVPFHQQPFPSVADAGYLTFYVLVFAGLILLPVRKRVADRYTLWFDVATVAVGTVMAVWYLVVGPTLANSDGWSVALVLSLAYPVGDFILVLGATRVLLREPERDIRTAIAILAPALIVLAVADVVYARLNLANSYRPGTLPDALWITALTGIAAAAYTQRHIRRPSTSVTKRRPHPAGTTGLPNVAILGGFVLLVYEATRHDRTMTWISIGAFTLTGLVTIRQALVTRENLRLMAALDVAAATDPLTGLLNRRRFFDLAAPLVQRLQYDHQPTTVLMIDVYSFKGVNDQHGHNTGDQVLRHIATQCAAVLRPGDLLGRFGGDELIAILPATTAIQAHHVALRIRRALRDTPVLTDDGVLPITLSIGLAENTRPDTLDDIVSRADHALYLAKQSGKDCAVIADTPATT